MMESFEEVMEIAVVLIAIVFIIVGVFSLYRPALSMLLYFIGIPGMVVGKVMSLIPAYLR